MDTKLWTQSCGQKVVDTTLRKKLADKLADKFLDTRGHLWTNLRTHASKSCGHTRTSCGQSCGHMRTSLRTHADKVVDTRGQVADKVVDTCGQTCGHADKVVDTRGQVADKAVATCGQTCGCMRTKLRMHADNLVQDRAFRMPNIRHFRRFTKLLTQSLVKHRKCPMFGIRNARS